MRLEGDDLKQSRIIHDAIKQTLDTDFPPGTLLVRWALVIDVMDPDDERHLARIFPDGTTWWEARGILSSGALGLGEGTDEE